MAAQGSSLEAGSPEHHTAGGAGRGEKVLLTARPTLHPRAAGPVNMAAGLCDHWKDMLGGNRVTRSMGPGQVTSRSTELTSWDRRRTQANL